MGQFSFVMDSFLQILNMSFAASFVIVVVILARLLLKKAPKVFSYLLWGVVLLRLICPLTIESEFSILPVNANPISPSIIYDAVPEIDTGIDVLDRVVNESLPPATPDASMNPMQGNVLIYSLIWGMVAAAMLLYAAISYQLLRRRLRCAMVVDGNIYESEKVASPFVLGILRPCIYLPLGIDGDEYSYIVAHEQTHIRRLDHLVKITAFVVLCVHWFNPFCWLAFVLMSRDMEMSCDEAVIKWLGSGVRREYSASLLSLSGYRMIINGSPLAFGESGVKGRIKNIMHYRRPTFWVVAAAVIVAVSVTAGLMLSPKQSEPPVDDVPVVDSPAAEVNNLTDEEIKGIVTDLVAKAENVGIIWSAEQFTATPIANTELMAIDYENQPTPQLMELVQQLKNVADISNYCSEVFSRDMSDIIMSNLINDRYQLYQDSESGLAIYTGVGTTNFMMGRWLVDTMTVVSADPNKFVVEMDIEEFMPSDEPARRQLTVTGSGNDNWRLTEDYLIRRTLHRQNPPAGQQAPQASGTGGEP